MKFSKNIVDIFEIYDIIFQKVRFSGLNALGKLQGCYLLAITPQCSASLARYSLLCGLDSSLRHKPHSSAPC